MYLTKMKEAQTFFLCGNFQEETKDNIKIYILYVGVSKNRGKTPKMDGS